MIFVHQNRLSNDFQNYVYLKGAYLLTYMRVFSFGQKTPQSEDGCMDHCNVDFT